MCPELNDTAQDMFYMQLKLEEDCLKSIQEKLEIKLQFNHLCKQAFNPGSVVKHAQDPAFHYFVQCFEDQDNVLPLLRFVTNRKLYLESYTLSIGHAKALAKACQFFETTGVNAIVFDNCGVDDDEMSAIL